jgi:tRNA (guanine37-N1)-methyltransferase
MAGKFFAKSTRRAYCCGALLISHTASFIPCITNVRSDMQLRDQLKGSIPETVLCHISNRFDVIGDIAVLQLAPELENYRHTIAQTIISRRRGIHTVLDKITKLEGGNRTARYDILAGSGTVTTHHEYGYSYRLDVSTVFFNPGLATERKRVTDQVQPGETVVVPFCGAGPFAIPAAAHGADVVAVEQNPDACRWFTENCELNDVADHISLVSGDAFDTGFLRRRMFDRAIIPTPYGMDQCLEVFSPFVRKEGMIHFYTFKKRTQIEPLTREFETRGLDVLTKRRCGNVAPSVSRWVFDLMKNR